MKTSFLTRNASLHFIVYSLFFFFTFIAGCKKADDTVNRTSSLSIKVIATSPENAQPGSAFDGAVQATLSTGIDTANYNAFIAVTQNEMVVQGKVTIEDSTVSFTPDVELANSLPYTATLSISAKGTGPLIFAYKWNFTTKGPDEFLMTKRSNSVTDFVRDGSRMAQIGKSLYSFGGWNVPERSYNDVYKSSGDLSAWEKLPDAPWHGRHVYGIASMNGATYIIGGDNLQSTFDVWRTSDGENWTLLATNILGNRIYYGCTAHNGYLYIVGGAGHNDVWRSRNGIKWEPVADNVEFLKGECFAGSLASFHGKLWMVCGGTNGYGQGEIRKEVWSSIEGKVWKKERDFGGSKRYYTDICVWDNKLWVIGGYNHEEGNIKSIWYMKPDGTWKEYETPNDYIGRHATAIAVYNNSLVITCGNYNNDCWVIEKTK
jgi:N-acetylneuraminic acid mutarotase